MTAQQEWQKYFYPGTTVLQNRFGITDPVELGLIERLVSHRRQTELVSELKLELSPASGHLQMIHHHLFQDVYDWAGEIRTHGMAKDGHVFAPASTVQIYLDRASDLAALPDWPTLNQHQATRYAGTLYAWVNHAHPFREG